VICILFTICIPVYTYKKAFKRTLKSIEKLNQNLISNIVCYIQPSDSTNLVIDEINKSNLDIDYIINKKNVGMVNNWNKCIEKCDSNYLIINHDDDHLISGILEKYKRIFNNYSNLGLLASKPILNKEIIFKKIVKKIMNNFGSINYYNKGDITDFVKNDFTLTCSSVSFNLKKLKKNYLFSNKYPYSSDEELWVRILKDHPIAVLKSWFVVRNINDENYEFETWKKKDFFEQYIQIRKDIYNYSGKDEEVFNYFYNNLFNVFDYINNKSDIEVNDQKWINYYKKICKDG